MQTEDSKVEGEGEGGRGRRGWVCSFCGVILYEVVDGALRLMCTLCIPMVKCERLWAGMIHVIGSGFAWREHPLLTA